MKINPPDTIRLQTSLAIHSVLFVRQVKQNPFAQIFDQQQGFCERKTADGDCHHSIRWLRFQSLARRNLAISMTVGEIDRHLSQAQETRSTLAVEILCASC